MKYRLKVPKPSAKRLEKDRCVIITLNGRVVGRYPIPEGVEECEFEFDGVIENEPINPYETIFDDDGLMWKWYVRFQNTTGSRVEDITFELERVENA